MKTNIRRMLDQSVEDLDSHMTESLYYCLPANIGTRLASILMDRPIARPLINQMIKEFKLPYENL